MNGIMCVAERKKRCMAPLKAGFGSWEQQWNTMVRGLVILELVILELVISESVLSESVLLESEMWSRKCWDHEVPREGWHERHRSSGERQNSEGRHGLMGATCGT